MDYKALDREEFDAVVTGELTHYALWLESEIIGIVSDYFVPKGKRDDFERLILRREGLTFQAELEITRAMLPLFKNKTAAAALKPVLAKVEEFKATRNAFAHGVDVTPDKVAPPAIRIAIVTRSGKEKRTDVTPESHRTLMGKAEALLAELQIIRKRLRT